MVVSMVYEGSNACDVGIEVGDVVVATSATIGSGMWPKTTVEGGTDAVSTLRASTRPGTYFWARRRPSGRRRRGRKWTASPPTASSSCTPRPSSARGRTTGARSPSRASGGRSRSAERCLGCENLAVRPLRLDHFSWESARTNPVTCFGLQGPSVENEENTLVDGTLIDLCGATLLWRSAEGTVNYRKFRK